MTNELFGPQPITLDQQLACLKREIAMRKNVYPKWVEGSRMTQEKADHEIAAMQAVFDRLSGLAGDPTNVVLAGSLLASTSKISMPSDLDSSKRIVGWLIPGDLFEHPSDGIRALDEISRGYRATVPHAAPVAHGNG